MKTIIAGSRTFQGINEDALYEFVGEFESKIGEITTVINGLAEGGDEWGGRYAEANSLKQMHFPAKWKQHGNAAGHIRNSAMAEHAEALMAFWDGKSTGTKDMVKKALKKKIPVGLYIYFGGNEKGKPYTILDNPEEIKMFMFGK